MKRAIIAFAGLMGSGKTTAAKYLVEKHGFERVRFAQPLKAMCYAFGLTEDHIEGALKELPCDLIGGKSPRYFMQKLGTEFGRNMIYPNLWIMAWENAVFKVPQGVHIVVDDCRFPNEASAIYKVGDVARIIRLVRTTEETNSQAHASELQTFPCDSTILNESTIENLNQELDTLVKRTLRTLKHI